jgi:hypothetical protein
MDKVTVGFARLGWRKNPVLSAIATGLTDDEFDLAMEEAMRRLNNSGKNLAENLKDVIAGTHGK